MLNRTNRTLSANTNRLDLGTRSLAVNASANNGGLTLRTAHDHYPVTVRVGFEEYPGLVAFEVPGPLGPKPRKPAMPSMSGSSPESSRPRRGCAIRDQQGQLIPLASRPISPIVLIDDRPRWDRQPLDPSPRRLARTSLAWRRARAARAALTARTVLLSDAAP